MQTSLKEMANAVRALSVDAVENAKSGHLGLPLGMADAATVLFTRFLKHNPVDPDWPDRDRFVLSAGHGSMLLYSLLHLTGYEGVSRDDIRNFRQLGSTTPGHPENFITKGVETTTGPLGQGIATAVGMALAERHLNAKFGDDLVNHKTYVIAGDGCLMEGVSQEAITLAGAQKLSNLIVLFDDNSITIDGATDLSDRTDQCARFEASGWAVRRADGHDFEDVEAALEWAQTQDKPVMIAVKTIIGFGAKRAGTGSAHGGPYGAEEAETVKQSIEWSHPTFEIPSDIERAWKAAGTNFVTHYVDWRTRLENSEFKQAFLSQTGNGHLDDLSSTIKAVKSAIVEGGEDKATRQWSGIALESLTGVIPQLMGGSADLTGSNNTRTSHMTALTPDDRSGRYVHYGVREHGMAAAMNGMALHGGVIPYSGTFLVFADYGRGAIRLGALMGAQVIHVMTHDSIGLGEDGPTHQPVEQLASLRAMPNMLVFRPCDGVETAECWEVALSHMAGPSTMALTRQKLKSARTVHFDENKSANGAYILADAVDAAAVIVATGSEVEIALAAKDALAGQGIPVRVVSMPCMELFAQQSSDYQNSVLPESLPKVAVEAAVRFGWDRWIGPQGHFIGMDGFGASAPCKVLYEHFSITPEAIVEAVRAQL